MSNHQRLKIERMARETGTSRTELLLLAREESHNARLQSLHELSAEAASGLIRTLERVGKSMLVSA